MGWDFSVFNRNISRWFLLKPLTFLINCFFSQKNSYFPWTSKILQCRTDPKEVKMSVLGWIQSLVLSLEYFFEDFCNCSFKTFGWVPLVTYIFWLLSVWVSEGKWNEGANFEFLDRVLWIGHSLLVGGLCYLSKAFNWIDFDVLMAKLRCNRIQRVASHLG